MFVTAARMCGSSFRDEPESRTVKDCEISTLHNNICGVLVMIFTSHILFLPLVIIVIVSNGLELNRNLI